jgi:hypothetical protein
VFLVKVVVLTLAFTGCSSPPATLTTSLGVHCLVIEGKADARCTPGVASSAVTQENINQTICVPGYTKTIRPPSAYTNLLKTRQMQEYGESGLPRDYEEDHLIPLTAGGDPRNPSNLFPQPWSGSPNAGDKDKDENQAHRDICSGRKTLVQAQQWIVAKWTH